MALTNMQVFEQYFYSAATEVIDQQVALFNEASAGTIQLSTVRNVGDYSHVAEYGNISSLIRRRNPYGSGTVTAVPLSQIKKTAVKVAGGTPPVSFEPQQMSWIQRSPDEAAAVIGEQFAKAQMQDMLNTAVRSLRAATAANPQVIQDDRPNRTTFRGLNRAAGKFGDRSNALRAWVIHGSAIHDIYDNALTNAEELFSFGDIRVMQDGFGRRFVITDSPALTDIAGTDNTYATLGLVENAVSVEDNNDLFMNIETTNGSENIARTWQAEFSYNVGMKGYSWDTASGGKAPNDAALASGANWDKYVTSDKDTAGVILLTA